MDVATELQRLTEQLNPLIQRAERAIQALGLKRSASVELTALRRLVFVDGRLWVVPDRAEFRGERTTTALTSSSRQIRLEALEALPRLVAALQDANQLTEEEETRILRNTEVYLESLERRGAR
jgi:hypothetical protein